MPGRCRISRYPFPRVIICLVLVAFSLTTAGWTPSQSGTTPRRSLMLDPFWRENGREICINQSIPLVFLVRSPAAWIEGPGDVSEAMVTVQDNHGRVKAWQTNAAGWVRFQWPAEQTGPLVLTAKAAKDGFSPSEAETYQAEVIDCKWFLKILYEEEFSIIREASFVVGATMKWQDSLVWRRGQGEDPIDEIHSSSGGDGNYRLYISDKIQAPIHGTMTPQVQGTYPIAVHGTVTNGQVHLYLSEEPLDLPSTVKINVVDTSGNYTITAPGIPYPLHSCCGAILGFNQLNEINLPAAGGSISVDSKFPIFFNMTGPTVNHITIMFYPLRGEQY